MKKASAEIQGLFFLTNCLSLYFDNQNLNSTFANSFK